MQGCGPRQEAVRWRRRFKHALRRGPLRSAVRMVDRSNPHFRNDLGIPSIKVGVTEFMCAGASPPFDHPHIFIDIGSDGEGICSYCSTRFVYDSSLDAPCSPPECELPEIA